MKFTKQENAMIKLAAAYMAPQMVKKATLQDKLAQYGIGMTKKAAGVQPNWPQNANPNMSRQEFNTYLQGARTATSPQERDEFLYQANLLPPRTQQDMAMNQLFSSFRSMPQRTPEQIGQNVQAIRSMSGAPQTQRADVARGAINEIKTNGWKPLGGAGTSWKPEYAPNFTKMPLADAAADPKKLNTWKYLMNHRNPVTGTWNPASTAPGYSTGRPTPVK